MLLQIDECELQVLREVIGSALQTLHDIDTPGYETMRQERLTVMLSLRERLAAEASSVLVGAPRPCITG
jgi:hypothetical protein